MIFLVQAAILTRIYFKVFFSNIKKCVTYLLCTISNIDYLHSSKTPSKSWLRYLVKFLTILYRFSFCSFLKKIEGSCIQIKSITVNLNAMRRSIDNNKLNSSWLSPFKTRYFMASPPHPSPLNNWGNLIKPPECFVVMSILKWISVYRGDKVE